MEITNLLEFTTRAELRQWFETHHTTERECWVTTTRSKHPTMPAIPYIILYKQEKFVICKIIAIFAPQK